MLHRATFWRSDRQNTVKIEKINKPTIREAVLVVSLYNPHILDFKRGEYILSSTAFLSSFYFESTMGG